MLFEKVKADFTVKNKKQQSALQVLAEASALHPFKFYYPGVLYLIDVVRVDLSYMFRETVDLIRDKEIIILLEERYLKHWPVNEKSEFDSFMFGKDEKMSRISGVSSIFKNEEGNDDIIHSSNEQSYKNLLINKLG